jgi:hypothetical protein
MMKREAIRRNKRQRRHQTEGPTARRARLLAIQQSQLQGIQVAADHKATRERARLIREGKVVEMPAQQQQEIAASPSWSWATSFWSRVTAITLKHEPIEASR